MKIAHTVYKTVRNNFPNPRTALALQLAKDEEDQASRNRERKLREEAQARLQRRNR